MLYINNTQLEHNSKLSYFIHFCWITITVIYYRTYRVTNEILDVSIINNNNNNKTVKIKMAMLQSQTLSLPKLKTPNQKIPIIQHLIRDEDIDVVKVKTNSNQ